MRKGGYLETQLRVMHRGYLEHDLGWVVPTFPEAKMVGKDLTFTGKGPPDFVGCVNGSSVCFEAKECASHRWPFNSLLRKKSDHQARALESVYRFGGYAFVVVYFSKSRTFKVMPWAAVREDFWNWRSGETPASVSIDDPRWVELDGVDWMSEMETGWLACPSSAEHSESS